MHWLPVEISLNGKAVAGRYRILRDRVEVEWNGVTRTLPYGLVRPHIAAANILRSLVRSHAQAH